MRPDPYDTAVMLVAMVRRVGGKRGDGTRWRISSKTIRTVSQRAALRDAFMEDVEEELNNIGFTLIWLPDGSYGLIKSASFDSWPLISMRDRLAKEMKAISKGDKPAFDELIAQAYAEFAEVGGGEENEDGE